MNHIFLFVLLIHLSAVVPRHMDPFNEENMRHVKINYTLELCLQQAVSVQMPIMKN